MRPRAKGCFSTPAELDEAILWLHLNTERSQRNIAKVCEVSKGVVTSRILKYTTKLKEEDNEN